MTGSTSSGRGAFENALLNASMWRSGYAADVDLNPDCIIGRLGEAYQNGTLNQDIDANPVLSSKIKPSMAMG